MASAGARASRGRPATTTFAGSGGGVVNPVFVQHIQMNDRGTDDPELAAECDARASTTRRHSSAAVKRTTSRRRCRRKRAPTSTPATSSPSGELAKCCAGPASGRSTAGRQSTWRTVRQKPSSAASTQAADPVDSRGQRHDRRRYVVLRFRDAGQAGLCAGLARRRSVPAAADGRPDARCAPRSMRLRAGSSRK
jgi:hypothetical protein